MRDHFYLQIYKVTFPNLNCLIGEILKCQIQIRNPNISEEYF